MKIIFGFSNIPALAKSVLWLISQHIGSFTVIGNEKHSVENFE